MVEVFAAAVLDAIGVSTAEVIFTIGSSVITAGQLATAGPVTSASINLSELLKEMAKCQP